MDDQNVTENLSIVNNEFSQGYGDFFIGKEFDKDKSESWKEGFRKALRDAEDMIDEMVENFLDREYHRSGEW